MRVFGVILALATLCGCARLEAPRPDLAATAEAKLPGQPADRAESLTELDVPGERVAAAEERLGAAIREIAPTLTVERTASASSGESRFVAALVGDGSGGFGVVTLSWEVPPFTQAEIACGKSPDCRAEIRADGSGLVIIERDGYGSVERYRADRFQERWLTASKEATAAGARFWSGGRALAKAPLTVEQLTKLTDRADLTA